MPKIAKDMTEKEIIEELSIRSAGNTKTFKFSIGGKSCQGLMIRRAGGSVAYVLRVCTYEEGVPIRHDFGLGSFYNVPLNEVRARVQRARKAIEGQKFDLRMFERELYKM